VLGLERGKVQLVPYQPVWPQLFEVEALRLRQLIGSSVEHIEHVGSTAIPGMESKPIIDLMASVPSMATATSLIALLEASGYEFRPEDSWSDRVFLANGPRARRTHHLSFTTMNSGYWKDHLLFRDFLRTNPGHVEAYSRLKRDLARRFPQDRRAYTEAKNEFVTRILVAARAAV
jgi:GrpB-like predicted nucleotidyltransferase (UPF0157 family)